MPHNYELLEMNACQQLFTEVCRQYTQVLKCYQLSFMWFSYMVGISKIAKYLHLLKPLMMVIIAKYLHLLKPLMMVIIARGKWCRTHVHV